MVFFSCLLPPAFLPVSVMLPPRRLELLLRQAVQLQVDKCPFHYLEQDVSSYSLLTDHICTRLVSLSLSLPFPLSLPPSLIPSLPFISFLWAVHAVNGTLMYCPPFRCNFPSETVHLLKDHTDEVWFVKFSNDGQKLASGSKDGQIIIWKIEVGRLIKFNPVDYFTSLCVWWCSVITLNYAIQEEEFIKQHVIKGHGAPVAGLSWSPDDSLLLSCGHEDCSDILVYNAKVR